MNILILDDHPIILNSLEQSLKSIVPYANVLCTTNIDDANKIISNNQINYAICDVQIVTGKSTLIPSICFKNKIPYMIYSSHVNKTLISKFSEIGLTVYVSKSSPKSELNKGIQSLLNNQKYNCSYVQITINSSVKEIKITPIVYKKHQKRILELLAAGYSQSETANMLFLAERTVLNHLAILRDVNDCHSTADLIFRYRFWET